MQRRARALLCAAALSALLSVAAAGCTGNGCSEEEASALCNKDNAGLPTGCPNMAPNNIHPQDGEKTCQRVFLSGVEQPHMVRCRFKLFGPDAKASKYEPFDKNQAPAGTPNTPAALKTMEFKFRRECKKSDPIALRTGTLPAIAGTNVAAGTALPGTDATYELKVTAVGTDGTTEYDITVTSELFRDAKLKVFFRASFKTEAEAPAPSDFSLYEFANPVVTCPDSATAKCKCPQDVTTDSTGLQLGTPGLVVDPVHTPSPVVLKYENDVPTGALLGVEAVAKFTAPSVSGATPFAQDSNGYYTLALRAVTPSDKDAEPCPSTIVPEPALNLNPRKRYVSSTTEVTMNLCPGRKYEYALSACYQTPDVCAENDAIAQITVPAVPPRRHPEAVQVDSGIFSVAPGTFSESPFGFPAKIDQFTPFWDGGSAITVYKVKVTLVATTAIADCPLDNPTNDADHAAAPWKEFTAGSELSLGKLCPGYQYNVWLDACHLEGSPATLKCASESGNAYGPVATTMPVVQPICKTVSNGALAWPTLSGISYKADGANPEDVDIVMDEYSFQKYGYKTAILSFSPVYSGGAAWSTIKFNIRRYNMGQNGINGTTYESIIRGPSSIAGRTAATIPNSALANNINPSHCYGYTMNWCTQVPGEAAPRCCETGVSLTWFMPSNARFNKDYCDGVNPGGQTAVGLRSIAGGAAGSPGTLVLSGPSGSATGAGAAAGASANVAADVPVAAAAGAANNNLILAVAIAVPAGVAVIAVVAVASVAYIVKSRNVGAMTASEIDAIRAAARASAYTTGSGSGSKGAYAPLPASRSASFRVAPADVPMGPLNIPQPSSFGDIAAARTGRASRSFSCVGNPEMMAAAAAETEVREFGAPTVRGRASGSSSPLTAPHIDA